MKRRFCVILFLLLSLNLLYSCNGHKCSNEEFERYFTDELKGWVDMARGDEKIISKKGNIETVKESDLCGRTLYLYQRLRLSNDSTELHGIFKAFYVNGQLRYSINYENGMETGYGKEYWLNGKLKYKTFKVAGIPSGPQFKYDSSGLLQEVRFSSPSDQPYWLRVVYDKQGEIDSLLGQVYYFFHDTRIKKDYEVGERMYSLLFVPKLENTTMKVHLNISNKVHSFDTVISKFYYHLNAKCSFLSYKFQTQDMGKNMVKMVATLFDSTSQKLIKADSFETIINVD